MIEIIALFFFSKKIREICEEKGIKAGKWVGLLIGAWFSVELLVMLGGMYFLDISLEDESIFQLVIPAMLAGIATAFFVLQKVRSLDSEKEDIELDEFAAIDRDEEFKHFR